MSDRMSQEDYVRMILREEAPKIIAAALTLEDRLEEAGQRLRLGVDGATRLTDEQLVSALWEAASELVPGDDARDLLLADCGRVRTLGTRG